jgi:hypothetical protein
MPIEAAGDLLYTNAETLRVWYRQGAEWRMADGPPIPAQVRLHGESDGRVWLGGAYTPGKPAAVSWIRFHGGEFQRGEERLYRDMMPPSEVIPAGPDTIFTAHTTGAFRFVRKSAGPFLFRAEYSSSLPVGSNLLAGDRSEVWYEACGQWLSSRGRSFSLPGAVGVTADPSGGLWAALGEKGLQFAGSESTIHTHSLRGLPDRPVRGVSRLGRRLYVARHDATAVIEDGQVDNRCDGTPSSLPALRPWGKAGADARFTNITADADGSVWVVGKNRGVMHFSADGAFLDVVSGAESWFAASIRELAFSPDGRLWAASKENLAEVVRRPVLTYAMVFPGLRYVSGFSRSPDGQLYAISDGGLFRYTNGHWEEMPLPPCLLSTKPRTVVLAEPGEIWFGYRDRDGFTKAVRKAAAWSCRHFEESGGFPGDTQFLGLDGQGRLWRGSETGVFIRRTDDHWARILEPEGEMHQLFHVEPDGSVLLAMGDRLLRLPPRFADADPGVPPQISYLGSETGVTLAPSWVESQLGSGAVLYVSALPERDLAAPAPIQYRFDSGSWAVLSGHQMPLDNAPRGARRLELRYAGSAQLTALPLSIAIPWWRSFWFFGALSVGLCGLAWRLGGIIQRLIYHLRKRRFLARSRPAAERHESAPPRGTLLNGRYRIEGLLAGGGFSQVFGAIDERNGDRVVVKRLRTSGIPPDRLRRRFAQEVAAASMVRHPGIPPINDAWLDDAFVPHLVMPHIDGPTLRERLNTGGLPRATAIELIGQLADILAAAHARGVIHSDLKPENILLSADRPVIIDFGASVLHLSAGLSEYTRPAGSVHYMAPEQLLGRSSKATDVYSFAVVAFELLTNRRYVEVDLPMNDQWEAEFLKLAQGELGLTANQAVVFVEALRFDPERRAQDIAAWADKLRSAG